MKVLRPYGLLGSKAQGSCKEQQISRLQESPPEPDGTDRQRNRGSQERLLPLANPGEWVADVSYSNDKLTVDLEDGRSISVPLAW